MDLVYSHTRPGPDGPRSLYIVPKCACALHRSLGHRRRPQAGAGLRGKGGRVLGGSLVLGFSARITQALQVACIKPRLLLPASLLAFHPSTPSLIQGWCSGHAWGRPLVPRVQFPCCSLTDLQPRPPRPQGALWMVLVPVRRASHCTAGAHAPHCCPEGIPGRVCGDSDSPAFTPPFCFVPRGRLLAGKRRCG